MNSQTSDSNHCSQRNLNTYYTAGVHHFNLRSVHLPSGLLFYQQIMSVKFYFITSDLKSSFSFGDSN